MGLIELRAPRAGMFVDAMERVLYLGAIVCDDRHRGWPPPDDDRASGPPAYLSHDENPTRWLSRVPDHWPQHVLCEDQEWRASSHRVGLGRQWWTL